MAVVIALRSVTHVAYRRLQVTLRVDEELGARDDAVADRDGELAELLVRRHLGRARQSITSQLEKSND